MYNNRRNNRFSIFIAAIIVSLLVLLTGCASTKKETDLAKPVAEDSSNPVTVTVYLTAHYANPDTHCPIYEKLLDYQKENPNITIQFVSPKEGDTAEREAEIHQLNTEILSGKGPDLFIMEGNRLTNVNLFPDIEKSMMNGRTINAVATAIHPSAVKSPMQILFMFFSSQLKTNHAVRTMISQTLL